MCRRWKRIQENVKVAILIERNKDEISKIFSANPGNVLES